MLTVTGHLLVSLMSASTVPHPCPPQNRAVHHPSSSRETSLASDLWQTVPSHLTLLPTSAPFQVQLHLCLRGPGPLTVVPTDASCHISNNTVMLPGAPLPSHALEPSCSEGVFCAARGPPLVSPFLTSPEAPDLGPETYTH